MNISEHNIDELERLSDCARSLAFKFHLAVGALLVENQDLNDVCFFFDEVLSQCDDLRFSLGLFSQCVLSGCEFNT